MTMPGFGHVLDLHEDRVLSWDERCTGWRRRDGTTNTLDRVPCECATNGHVA